MWVFDATALIYLAKVDRLALVQQLDTSCVIPERVYEEVVETGLEQGYPDARRIERSVNADRFDIVSVETTPLLSRLQDNSNLSDADVAVLAYADVHDGVAVMDETYGRDVAAAEGITTRGTAYLVLKLTTEGALSVDDARTVIDAMIDEGWYCAPDVYAKIVQKLESLAD
jgi:predicted nucleic acid-binding protein